MLNIFTTPVIILVEPQLPENIGMVARAMANFGLQHLRLVKPIADFPSEKSYSTASKADHILDNAMVYDSLTSAVSDLNYLYASTARQRANHKPVKSPVTVSQELREKIKGKQTVGILFGREKSGLTNEEVSLADDIVTFPVNSIFSSLNIAQAVLLLAYEWQKSGLQNQEETNFNSAPKIPAKKEDLYGLLRQLENALQLRGYFRPLEKKEIMSHNIRDILTRAGFSVEEICLLRGVISSLEKYEPVHSKVSLKKDSLI
ncbi:RNA methyltransferase [Bartonella sp. DGB1]|uniref:RNA methyltransferase n=1 Tax=Bartonella sp. DGB1 TaxID=3239807 RepID=UPI0035236FC4